MAKLLRKRLPAIFPAIATKKMMMMMMIGVLLDLMYVLAYSKQTIKITTRYNYNTRLNHFFPNEDVCMLLLLFAAVVVVVGVVVVAVVVDDDVELMFIVISVWGSYASPHTSIVDTIITAAHHFDHTTNS